MKYVSPRHAINPILSGILVGTLLSGGWKKYHTPLTWPIYVPNASNIEIY